MEESNFLGVTNPVNLYGICKVWHTGVLKVLVASENEIRSVMSIEDAGGLKWNFEKDAILTLPERSQVISIATANPLMLGESNSGSTTPKLSRRCLIGVTYCIPPPPQETLPVEPDPAPAARAPTQRTTGPSNSFVSRVLQATRPAPQPQNKPTESAPQPSMPPRFFFSILGANSLETDHWSTIVRDNVTFELPYVPFVLAKYAPSNSSSMLFLLSGADRKLHVFNQHADTNVNEAVNMSTEQTSKEPHSSTPASLHLPLLDQYPSAVVSLDILDAIDGKIYVVVGCQDGTAILTYGDSHGTVEHTSFIHLDGPLTSVKIYQVTKSRNRVGGSLIPVENDQHTSKNTHPSVRRLNKHINRTLIGSQSLNDYAQGIDPSQTPVKDSGDLKKATTTECVINVVVASAIGYAAIFKNVKEKDFNDFQLLPDSDKHDAVLGLAVADVDHDGQVEILVGTYGQKLLAYAEAKHVAPIKRTTVMQKSTSSERSGVAPQTHLTSTPSRESLLKASTSIIPPISANADPIHANLPTPSARFGSSPPTFPSLAIPLAPTLSTTETSTSSIPPPTSESASVISSADVSGRTTPDPDSAKIFGTQARDGLRSAIPTLRDSAFTLPPDAVSVATESPSPSFSSEPSERPSENDSANITTLGMGFAKIFDQKQEQYRRENVVTSIIPTTLTQQLQTASNPATHEVNESPTDITATATSSGTTMSTTSAKQSPFLDFRSPTSGPTKTSLKDQHSSSQSNTLLHTEYIPEASSNLPEEPVNSFSLLWHRSFTHPVYQILCDDFLQDGTISAVVSTLYGVHLCNFNFDETVATASRRLQLLSDIIKLERQLHRHERNKSKEGSGARIPPLESPIVADLQPS